MKEIILPSYSIGKGCYDSLGPIVKKYGPKIVLIHGDKAYQANRAVLDEVIIKIKGAVIASFPYGLEASYENVERLLVDINHLADTPDLIFAIGGGKSIDTAKVVADKLQLPVITFPTIASTCAAITKISVMYTAKGEFKEVYNCSKAPEYCVIDTEVIMNAPLKYLWAGIGDTLAKHVETHFSSRNDIIGYQDELALQVSYLCYDSIIKHATQGYHDAQNKMLSEELEITIQNILVSTGIVSILINPNYNSALAHALFYGLTCRKEVEDNHLHGEVVAYGVLIQLIVDQKMDELNQALNFYKTINLPTCLADLGLSSDDDLADVLKLTVVNKELLHIPYPITKTMIKVAMEHLETLH